MGVAGKAFQAWREEAKKDVAAADLQDTMALVLKHKHEKEAAAAEKDAAAAKIQAHATGFLQAKTHTVAPKVESGSVCLQ